MTFNKRAIQANNVNHDKVVQDLQVILDKYEESEAKKMQGLSPEMAEQKRSKKPPEILRTEAFLKTVNKNYGG